MAKGSNHLFHLEAFVTCFIHMYKTHRNAATTNIVIEQTQPVSMETDDPDVSPESTIHKERPGQPEEPKEQLDEPEGHAVVAMEQDE